MSFVSMIKQFTEPLKRRIMLALARGVVTAINDTTKLQALQVSLLAGEIRDDLERFQEYGFTSVPFPQAEAAVVFLGGNRDHGLVIAVDDRRYRLQGLANGEVAIYTDEADKIYLRRGNKIEVHTKELAVIAADKVSIATKEVDIQATTKVDINTPQLNVAATVAAAVNTPNLTETVTAQKQTTTPAWILAATASAQITTPSLVENAMASVENNSTKVINTSQLDINKV